MAIQCINYGCSCPKCNPEYWCIEGERLMDENKKLEVDSISMQSCIGHLRDLLPDVDDNGVVEKISRLALLERVAEAGNALMLYKKNGSSFYPDWDQYFDALKDALRDLEG